MWCRVGCGDAGTEGVHCWVHRAWKWCKLSRSTVWFREQSVHSSQSRGASVGRVSQWGSGVCSSDCGVGLPSRSGAGPSALPVSSLPPLLQRVVAMLTATRERWWENGGPAVPELSCQSLTIWCLCCHKAFSCAVLCLSSGYGAAEQSPAPTLLLLLSILRSHHVQKWFCALVPTCAWPSAAALCLPLCPDASCTCSRLHRYCRLLHGAIEEKMRVLLLCIYNLKNKKGWFHWWQWGIAQTSRHMLRSACGCSWSHSCIAVPILIRSSETWGYSTFIVVFDLNLTDDRSFEWQRIMFSDCLFLNLLCSSWETWPSSYKIHQEGKHFVSCSSLGVNSHRAR